MPIIFTHQIDSSTSFCVWHITETEESLFNSLELTDVDKQSILSFSLKKRRLEQLACRNCLAFLLNNSKISIEYGQSGEPLLENYFLSFSHSHNYATAILSSAYAVGIDIEKITAKILSLSYKFLNDNEIAHSDIKNPEAIHYIWGAKEAIFKLYKKGNIDFISQMHINSQKQYGILKIDNTNYEFKIDRWKIDDMLLVSACDINHNFTT